MSTRMFKIAALFLLIAAISLACTKGAPTPQSETPAITEAVKTYVRDVKKIEVEKVDITIKDLKIEGDNAQCQASFALKAQQEMAFTYAYTLEKKGGKWTVLSSGSAEGPGHGAMPGGAPGAMHGEMDGSMGGEMPPGHPPVGDANAPAGVPPMAGHPPVGDGMPSPHGGHPPAANAPAK